MIVYIAIVRPKKTVERFSFPVVALVAPVSVPEMEEPLATGRP